MLQDVHEYYSSHVCVVGCLVVVRKQGLPCVVAAMILSIILAAQVALELIILCTLLVDLAKRGVVESFGVVGQHFSVVCEGEAGVPFLSELQIRLWQRSNKLVIQVNPIVHAVVTNNRLFGLNHGLND